MNIEHIIKTKIAYLRRTGAYGIENNKLMEHFKQMLKERKLLNGSSIILGIALDNPAVVASSDLRYDVAIIVDEATDIPSLKTRYIEAGNYAIFEVNHTKEDVALFWNNIHTLTDKLNINYQLPILERYKIDKLKQGLCEFCIPIK